MKCSQCHFQSENEDDFQTTILVDNVPVKRICRSCAPTVQITCTHGRPTFAVCPHCMKTVTT